LVIRAEELDFDVSKKNVHFGFEKSNMKQTIEQLEQLVFSFPDRLAGISSDEFSAKPFPDKWSKKEELGHLIDSGHNNLRRFITGQYESNPKILYDQNFWVAAANYQQQSSDNLIALWKLINLQICEVLKSMPGENHSKTADTGKAELHSLEWLAEDYVKHTQHHLHHILQLETIPY
jgi:hypothetical protein